MTILDKELYTATTAAVLQFTKNILSTRAIAAYVIDIMLLNRYYKQSVPSTVDPQKIDKIIPAQTKSTVIPKRILYLTHHNTDMNRGDYLTDLLLHGLVKLFGRNAVIDYPSRDVLYKTKSEFTGNQYHNRRKYMYGKGFSFGLLFDTFARNETVDYASIMFNVVDKMIEKKYFDLIILGSGHRYEDKKSKLPLWNKICEIYPTHKVAWIDGGDNHLLLNTVRLFSKCADHIFSREGFATKIKK